MSSELDGQLFKRRANGEPISPVTRRAIELGLCTCGGRLERLAYRNHALETRPWTSCGYRCAGCGAYYLEDLP